MINPEDVAGRFAVDDSFFRASDFSVKHRAFMPARDGCTSIFIITGLNHEACVAHGEEHVAVLRGKPVRGYVTVLARFISEQKLTITEDTPPPRHANILNWDVDLDAAKLQAMAIADNATYTPI